MSGAAGALTALLVELAVAGPAPSSLEACREAWAALNRGQEQLDDGLSLCEDAADDRGLTREERLEARLLASRVALAVEHALVADLQSAALWIIEPQHELPDSGLNTFEETLLADAKKRVRLDPPLVVTFQDPYTGLGPEPLARQGAPTFAVPIRDRYELVHEVTIVWTARTDAGLEAEMRVPMAARGPSGPERVWVTPVSDPLDGHPEPHEVAYRLELRTAGGDLIRLDAVNETIDAGRRRAARRAPTAAGPAPPPPSEAAAGASASTSDRPAPARAPPPRAFLADASQAFLVTSAFLLPLAGLQLVVAVASGAVLAVGFVVPPANPGLAGLHQITALATGAGGLACLALGGASAGAALGLYALVDDGGGS